MYAYCYSAALLRFSTLTAGALKFLDLAMGGPWRWLGDSLRETAQSARTCRV